MGKASKWIINFLLGKREDKGKKIRTLDPEGTWPSSVPAEASTVTVSTPNVRRRWSFKRSSSTKAITHKSSKSFDSIHTPKHALLGYDTEWDHRMHLLLNAHAAATKIQAVYRSYLARRALRALRGLVKLQALARGYLVRKQLNTVVRSMHAAVKIQVRARIHRIQMVEEPPPTAIRRKSCSCDRQLGKDNSGKTAGRNGLLMNAGLRSKSQRVEHVPAEREEYGCKISSPGHFSVSRREIELHMCPSPPITSITELTSTTYDGQPEEYSPRMAHRNSRRHIDNRHQTIGSPAQCTDYVPRGSYFVPNYMVNTKSSTAKARSDSEPRQRPKLSTKQRSRRSSSLDGKNDKENQYPWLIKLYRSGKSAADRDNASTTSAVTSISKNEKSLIPFEPPMNLY